MRSCLLKLFHFLAYGSFCYQGRKGLGSIFMWASGVGGYHGDSCAYDGFVNSIYSIAISAGTDAGKSPWYAEPCAAVLATGLSSGNPLSHKVVCYVLTSARYSKFTRRTMRRVLEFLYFFSFILNFGRLNEY